MMICTYLHSSLSIGFLTLGNSSSISQVLDIPLVKMEYFGLLGRNPNLMFHLKVYMYVTGSQVGSDKSPAVSAGICQSGCVYSVSATFEHIVLYPRYI